MLRLQKIFSAVYLLNARCKKIPNLLILFRSWLFKYWVNLYILGFMYNDFGKYLILRLWNLGQRTTKWYSSSISSQTLHYFQLFTKCFHCYKTKMLNLRNRQTGMIIEMVNQTVCILNEIERQMKIDRKWHAWDDQCLRQTSLRWFQTETFTAHYITNGAGYLSSCQRRPWFKTLHLKLIACFSFFK